MTTRGLWALTAAANTLQAREDWKELAAKAADMGWEDDQINKYAPNPEDGWRKIDKCIAALRSDLCANGGIPRR